MPFELFIALRYLKMRRHGLFALLTTFIAIGGVTLGIAALIVTLSVMNGFRADIQKKTLGIQPHIVLMGTEKDSAIELESLTEKIASVKGIRSVSPFVLGQLLLKSRRNSQGIVLRGIIPGKEFKVTPVRETLISGDWGMISQPGISGEHYLILGKELARNLSVTLGDDLVAFSPRETASLGAMGAVPKAEKFTVGGIFQSGMYDYDANMAMANLSDTEELFGMGGPSGLGLSTDNLDEADSIARIVGEAAGPRYWARSWQAMNRNLFSALKLEKIVMTVILTMIVLVASFTIISNLILMTIEKARDIGILRALGASQKSIKKIFLYAGTTLGTCGIILGSALGIGLTVFLGKTQWIKLPQDVYYIDTLPVKLSSADISMVLVIAFLITILSSIYPAAKAASLNPVDAIRYG